MRSLPSWLSGDRPGLVQHGRELAAQQRHPGDRLVVGDVGEQAEEAALADHLALGREELDPDVVEVGGPRDGGPAVGLGDDQHLLLAGLGAQLRRHRGEAARAGPVGAQHAEAGAGLGGQRVVLLQAVFAVAEEGEVAVGQPVEQLQAVLHLGRVERRRVDREVVGGGDGQGAHLRLVLDRAAHVVEDAQQVGLQQRPRGRVGLAVDLDVHPRLGQGQAGDVHLVGAEELAGHVAADPHLGVHDQAGAELVAFDLVGDRVDQVGHVVGDDLDHRGARVAAVLVERRGTSTRTSARPCGRTAASLRWARAGP